MRHRRAPRLAPPALLTGLLGALLAVAPARAAEGPNLRIVASNVTTASGTVVVWIFASGEQWLREAGARTQKAVPVAGNLAGDSVTVELLLPAGDYAAVVFHDQDGNGDLARNFLGLPKEPAGLSNNVRPRFGPPRFTAALFTVGAGVAEQRIRLE
jgi:uncharacterized protein (DUF2141 family)